MFWLAYVLGNLVLLFSFLVSKAPESIKRGDFGFYYILRLCLAGPMLVSILMARWIWKIGDPLDDPVSPPPVAMRVVVLVAWAELAFALFEIAALARLQLLGQY